jgi:hypothetical protein
MAKTSAARTAPKTPVAAPARAKALGAADSKRAQEALEEQRRKARAERVHRDYLRRKAARLAERAAKVDAVNPGRAGELAVQADALNAAAAAPAAPAGITKAQLVATLETHIVAARGNEARVEALRTALELAKLLG